jgi:hypothetical protein
LLDLADEKMEGVPLTLSHVAARQELRALLQAIALPARNSAWAKQVLDDDTPSPLDAQRQPVSSAL